MMNSPPIVAVCMGGSLVSPKELFTIHLPDVTEQEQIKGTGNVDEEQKYIKQCVSQVIRKCVCEGFPCQDKTLRMSHFSKKLKCKLLS